MNRSIAPRAGIAIALGAVLAFAHGCSKPKDAPPAPSGSEASTAPASTPAPAKPGFVNPVWQVKESKDVEPGMMYVFLSDGTLVLASPHGTPSFGKWTNEAGAFRIIEEGLPYDTEIAGLTDTEMKLNIKNPGGVTEITLEPAPTPPLAP